MLGTLLGDWSARSALIVTVLGDWALSVSQTMKLLGKLRKLLRSPRQ